MPLASRHLVLYSAEGMAMTHPLPSPCLAAGSSPGLASPADIGPLQEAESCINFQHSFFPFLSYSTPASLQLEFTLIAKTETSNNLSITLSLVFSSVLTMAKIQAQKWQHTGKALTF